MAPKLSLFASAWSHANASAAAAAAPGRRSILPFLDAVAAADTFQGVEMSLGDLGRSHDEQIEVREPFELK